MCASCQIFWTHANSLLTDVADSGQGAASALVSVPRLHCSRNDYCQRRKWKVQAIWQIDVNCPPKTQITLEGMVWHFQVVKSVVHQCVWCLWCNGWYFDTRDIELCIDLSVQPISDSFVRAKERFAKVDMQNIQQSCVTVEQVITLVSTVRVGMMQHLE